MRGSLSRRFPDVVEVDLQSKLESAPAQFTTKGNKIQVLSHSLPPLLSSPLHCPMLPSQPFSFGLARKRNRDEEEHDDLQEHLDNFKTEDDDGVDDMDDQQDALDDDLASENFASLTSQALNADGTPKRPMNAFMIFARRRRPQVSADNPSMRTGEISKILSKEWQGMTKADKQFYLDRAKTLKDEFNARWPDYVYKRRPNNSRKRRKNSTARHEDMQNVVAGPSGIPRDYPSDHHNDVKPYLIDGAPALPDDDSSLGYEPVRPESESPTQLGPLSSGSSYLDSNAHPPPPTTASSSSSRPNSTHPRHVDYATAHHYTTASPTSYEVEGHPHPHHNISPRHPQHYSSYDEFHPNAPSYPHTSSSHHPHPASSSTSIDSIGISSTQNPSPVAPAYNRLVHRSSASSWSGNTFDQAPAAGNLQHARGAPAYPPQHHPIAPSSRSSSSNSPVPALGGPSTPAYPSARASGDSDMWTGRPPSGPGPHAQNPAVWPTVSPELGGPMQGGRMGGRPHSNSVSSNAGRPGSASAMSAYGGAGRPHSNSISSVPVRPPGLEYAYQGGGPPGGSPRTSGAAEAQRHHHQSYGLPPSHQYQHQHPQHNFPLHPVRPWSSESGMANTSVPSAAGTPPVLTPNPNNAAESSTNTGFDLLTSPYYPPGTSGGAHQAGPSGYAGGGGPGSHTNQSPVVPLEPRSPPPGPVSPVSSMHQQHQSVNYYQQQQPQYPPAPAPAHDYNRQDSYSQQAHRYSVSSSAGGGRTPPSHSNYTSYNSSSSPVASGRHHGYHTHQGVGIGLGVMNESAQPRMSNYRLELDNSGQQYNPNAGVSLVGGGHYDVGSSIPGGGEVVPSPVVDYGHGHPVGVAAHQHHGQSHSHVTHNLR
ncbi:hypothetical protein FRC02_002754 [Tulasnella sp. 418]|nr:hypothetical protein FRC02_002754 [Tulasnella sp. 418]